MCLLSYPPEKLHQKLDFPNAIDDVNHQDAGKDLVRSVAKIGGEFVMSTTENNEDFGTVKKDSHFPKHSIMIIVVETRFMCRGNQSPHEVFRAVRRDKNFSNSFTLDFKNDTDINFFVEEFWMCSSRASSEDPAKKLWKASRKSRMDSRCPILVGNTCSKS